MPNDDMEVSTFLTLSDGRYFLDESQSKAYSKILEIDPFKSNEYRWDEIGVSEMFSEVFKESTLYCPEAKSWYVYDGKRWVKDVGDLETMDRLITFTKLLNLYANELSSADDSVLEKYKKFLSKLSDRRVRDRILRDAQTSARVSITRFDADPYLINCQNGTYHLKKNVCKAHNPLDYLTMITDCKCPTELDVLDFPRWESFIKEITCGDVKVARYLQRALGYSMLGVLKEECMFFAYGKTTRNGKGTLFTTILKVLGDYAKAMPVDFICSTKYNSGSYDRANPMLAGLKGKRLVILSESDNAGRLDVAAIKNYTGGDPITTRNLHEKDFTFTPTFKMWLQCNELPYVNDKSFFSSDRAKVVEFNAHFDEENRDTTLKEQFLTPDAKMVIFQWLAEGCREYRRIGLKDPDSVKSATSSYEKQNDYVGLFIDEKCEISDDYTVKRGDLYSAYKIWCKTNELYILSAPKFNEQMGLHARKVKIQGEQLWKGLKIKATTISLTPTKK